MSNKDVWYLKQSYTCPVKDLFMIFIMHKQLLISDIWKWDCLGNIYSGPSQETGSADRKNIIWNSISILQNSQTTDNTICLMLFISLYKPHEFYTVIWAISTYYLKL